MTEWLHIMMILATTVAVQEPTTIPAPAGLAADTGLQEALGQARASGLPHRMLLAEHIDTLIEEKKYEREEEFKIGAMAVLRHSDFSKDLVLGELYLRMLQQTVIDDVLDGFRDAQKIVIDGERKDWPSEALAVLPKPEARGKKAAPQEEPRLKSFGVIRGEDGLFVMIETHHKIDPASKVVFVLDLVKLADRFNEIAYTVNVAGQQVRFFNRKGEEFKLHEAQPVELKTGLQSLELRIPLKRFEEDLRSFAVRGHVVDLQAQAAQVKGPWVACSSGPITEPTAMLIEFAAKRELPMGNGLPVAVALQEGLLLARSHPDVAAEIRKDAYAWLELALEVSARQEVQGGQPVEKQPLTAQLAWTCRHDGATGLGSIEEYQSTVVSADTLRNLKGHAERQGWLTDASTEKLRGHINQFAAKEFKLFDYPDAAAREKGKEFEDARPEAYFVKGKDRLLCYRDVGINERWKLFEDGSGLKGSPEQALQLQRVLHMAVGLPALRAEHHNAENDTGYVISFDGRTRTWFPTAAPLTVSPKTMIHLMWCKPWTRPERFALSDAEIGSMPAGSVRLILDMDFDELSVKRLEVMLNKGIPDQMLSKSILAPLRMR